MLLLDPEFVEEKKELSSEQLAGNVREGRAGSFAELVERYQRPLFNYILQFTRNREDAEDLVQETFLKAWQHIGRYDPQFRFSTWLYAIARNSAISHFRKRRPNDPLSDFHLETIAAIAPEIHHLPEAEFLWTKARELKPGHFEVLWLRYGEGFSIAEIGRVTGRNLISIKVALHRARHALARKLKNKLTGIS